MSMIDSALEIIAARVICKERTEKEKRKKGKRRRKRMKGKNEKKIIIYTCNRAFYRNGAVAM